MGIAVDVCTNHPHEILACYGAVINDMVWKFSLMLRTTIVENIKKWIYQTTRRHICIIATILFIIQKKKTIHPRRLNNHSTGIQYIPRNTHTVFALLCFVVVIHWLIFPYPSGLLHWHCGNLTIAPVPAKQPWWIWINTSCEFIMNDCVTTTKQSTTKPCAYFLGYTVL